MRFNPYVFTIEVNDFRMDEPGVRQAIADQDAEKLQSYFSKSSIAGAEWWADRSLGNWAEREKRPDQEIPSAAEWMNRIFFGRLGVRRLLNETKKQNEDKKR